jgi:ornithine cyclodeaminase
MAGRVHVPVRACDTAEAAVRGADLVVLVTASPAPVVEDGWVGDGAHVISVGACRPDQREMAPSLVARARLFVDSRAAALVEAGDVVQGIREGRFDETHVAGELGQVLLGRVTGRASAREVTIFKSLGMAVEDVAAADLVYRRAEDVGAGTALVL